LESAYGLPIRVNSLAVTAEALQRK